MKNEQGVSKYKNKLFQKTKYAAIESRKYPLQKNKMKQEKANFEEVSLPKKAAHFLRKATKNCCTPSPSQTLLQDPNLRLRPPRQWVYIPSLLVQLKNSPVSKPYSKKSDVEIFWIYSCDLGQN